MIIGIVGPTGSGKSELAVRVALRFGGEVISCDSVQVYRGFDIGSGKIRVEEMQGVPHHLLDIRDGNEGFTAGEFVELANGLVEVIRGRGRVPIVVGGTGLYYRAFAYQYSLEESGPQEREVRDRLSRELEEEGVEVLYHRLRLADPEAAGVIDPRHSSRILRALCFAECHARGIGVQVQETKGLREDLVGFYLDVERDLLYGRINARVDRMVEEGLVGEVRGLLASGVRPDAAPMGTIGYREVVSYLKGEVSLEEAVVLIKQHSRNYAKRQVTWFRKHGELIRVPYNRGEDGFEILDMIGNFLKKPIDNGEDLEI